MNEVTLFLWNDGDPSVGIAGNSATVTTFIPDNDPESLRALKEVLIDAFKTYWDHKHVSCYTQEECDMIDEDDK